MTWELSGAAHDIRIGVGNLMHATGRGSHDPRPMVALPKEHADRIRNAKSLWRIVSCAEVNFPIDPGSYDLVARVQANRDASHFAIRYIPNEEEIYFTIALPPQRHAPAMELLQTVLGSRRLGFLLTIHFAGFVKTVHDERGQGSLVSVFDDFIQGRPYFESADVSLEASIAIAK